ncbi:MAG: hypothetical protein ACEQSF_01195 [Solirubrobacteraceae bacterium]
MKKLSTLLLIAFSFVLTLSCSPEEKAQLTSQQKIDLLVSNSWFNSNDANTTVCANKGYVNLNYLTASEENNGTYEGQYIKYTPISTNDNCELLADYSSVSYNPVTNELNYVNTKKIESSKDDTSTIVVTNNTITLDGEIYYKRTKIADPLD